MRVVTFFSVTEFSTRPFNSSQFCLQLKNRFGGGGTIMVALVLFTVLGGVLDTLWRVASQRIVWHGVAFVSLAAAYAIWRLDVARQFAPPESWFQGHALWHVLTAVTLGCMAIVYRTETPVSVMRVARSQEKVAMQSAG